MADSSKIGTSPEQTPPATPGASTPSARDASQDDHIGSRSSARLLARLSLNEWLTTLLGAAALAVSVLTYINSSDTRDIKRAVGDLGTLAQQTGTLAQQTKRQADAVEKQLGRVDSQVGALKEQVAEAKLQTAAISRQTDAITASSEAAIRAAEANVKSADAQKRMADVTTKAQLPSVSLTELTVEGIDGAPDENGQVVFKTNWTFRNTGGGAFKAKDVEFGLWIGPAISPQMPQGIHVAGNDYVISNSLTSSFSLKEPFDLRFPAGSRDLLKTGAAHLFFWAKFKYEEDGSGLPHTKCFGEEVYVRKGEATGFRPAGGMAYRCDN